MNKIGTLKNCPKCRNGEFDTKYRATKVEDLNRDEIVTDEYMELTCTRCSYEHKEAPLDADTTTSMNYRVATDKD